VADADATASAPPAPPQRLNGILVAAAAAMFMVQLDFFALNLALPPMSHDLGVSVTDLQWVVSGYMLALAAFLIPGGRLGDLFGRRRWLIIGVAIFVGSSTVCGAAPSAGVIIGFRVLQGIGAAIMFPLCVAVISNAFPAERQARAIGNLYGLAAIATAVGPFVGGFFTDALSWRWIFFANIPLGAFTIAMVLHSVRESRDETVPRRLDWAGLLAVAVGISLVTLAVDRGEEWGWLDAGTLATFLAGIAFLTAFVAIEKRVHWPLVDLSLFRNRPYVLVTVLGTISNVAFVSTTLATTIYLQQARGFSPIGAGAIFLACSVPLAFAGPLAGRLGERFVVSRVIPISMGIGAVGLAFVALDPGLGLYMAGLAVFGFGYGLGWSIVSVGTQQVVPIEKAGAASGVTLALVIGLGGLGVAITAALIEALTASGIAEGDAIQRILLVVAVSSAALGFLLDLASRRLTPSRPQAAG
jgi:EmrB/QacA subfamily drug resistance transporter